MLNKNRIRISQNTRRAIPSPRQFLTSFRRRTLSPTQSGARARCDKRRRDMFERVRRESPVSRMAMAHRDIKRNNKNKTRLTSVQC
jgi:hypothetical protein